MKYIDFIQIGKFINENIKWDQIDFDLSYTSSEAFRNAMNNYNGDSICFKYLDDDDDGYIENISRYIDNYKKAKVSLTTIKVYFPDAAINHRDFLNTFKSLPTLAPNFKLLSWDASQIDLESFKEENIGNEEKEELKRIFEGSQSMKLTFYNCTDKEGKPLTENNPQLSSYFEALSEIIFGRDTQEKKINFRIVSLKN